MLNINYILANDQLLSASDTDLKNADEMDFRYKYFLGDIIIEYAKIDLSARWHWIPVLDFGLSLIRIIDELKKTSNADFEFTESGETISFTMSEQGLVRIKASYVEGVIETEYNDLKLSSEELLAKLVRDLDTKYLELKDNADFQHIRKQICI